MPPRKRSTTSAPTAPSTMKELKDTLWKAADKLRGSMDASQYKDVILGLVFLKYVSDAFDERRDQIRAELAESGMDEDQIPSFLNDVDEYTGSGVFWIPEDARWRYLVDRAKGTPDATIGTIINNAMLHIEACNSALKATLPTVFAGESVDQRRLGELLDLFNSARFTGEGASKARDLLGEVYEYFLDKFAKAEGKRGGEYYTPPSVVRVLVEVLEPTAGRVYDPCCGSGGMFVQTEKFLEAHQKDRTSIAVYGQELNQRTWRMAKMNLAIHGLNANLGPIWGDTFAHDLHTDQLMKPKAGHPGGADFVMANPPFNIKDWARNEADPRWRHGIPPTGNANYAWIQHILSKLAPGGSAGVVMANGSMSTNSGGEGDIRAHIVEADLVSCMIALPTQLFRSTGIPVCLWFFSNDKKPGLRGRIDRSGQVLFIDARNLGYMIDRAERALSDDDVAAIANTVHNWRGTHSSVAEYADKAAFCYSATLAEVKAADYALTPGRYVGPADIEQDKEPIDAKIERLTCDLMAQFVESAHAADEVRSHLARVEHS